MAGVREILAKIGVKVDEEHLMREPQVIFYYNETKFDEKEKQPAIYYHWNHGWHRENKVRFLHMINKIAHPFKEIHTYK